MPLLEIFSTFSLSVGAAVGYIFLLLFHSIIVISFVTLCIFWAIEMLIDWVLFVSGGNGILGKVGS